MSFADKPDVDMDEPNIIGNKESSEEPMDNEDIDKWLQKQRKCAQRVAIDWINKISGGKQQLYEALSVTGKYLTIIRGV